MNPETITFAEVGMLLGLAAARDQRTTGDADTLAWHADLNTAAITYRDAQAALTRYYAVDMAALPPDHRRRITTPDLIGIARKLRAERLQNFRYDPDPDETPQQYLARLRGQLNATADGQRPPATDRPALEGGPHPDVAAAITGIGRTIPDTDQADEKPEPRPGPYGIRCPRCAAHIGRPCHSPHSNRRLARPHPARIRTAEGTPTNPATDQAEQDRRRQAARAYLAALPPHTVIEPADGYQPTPDADSEAS